MAGAQDTSTRRVVDKARRLHEVGYRHIVVTPTYYVRSTSAGEHLRLFGACREAVDGGEIIPYNIPQVTGSVIAVETFVKLARDGGVRYCKESSGDLEYLARLVTEGGEVGLKVFAGEERNAAEALRIGAVGLVPVCANIEPTTYLELYEAAARRRRRRDRPPPGAHPGAGRGDRAGRPVLALRARSTPWAGSGSGSARRSRRSRPPGKSRPPGSWNSWRGDH